MAFEIKYKPLFQVNILHQFYLDKGEETYSTMSALDKEKQLISYNISNYITVQASAESARTINGHNMVFQTSNAGFIVWVEVTQSDERSPFIELDDTMELSFLLKLNNHRFFNFSNLQFENTGKLFFFSNKRLSTEAGNFPLIKKTGTNNKVSDSYSLTTESSLIEREKLSIGEQRNLFGIVRIHMKGNSSGLNVTTAQNKIRNPNQVFEMVFENRKTTWRYIFNEDQVVKNQDDVKKENGSVRQLITKKKYPLTANGFVSIEHGGVELPNPDAMLVKPNSTNNKIYSEIYM